MFNLTANPANDRYLTADLGGDTNTVKLMVCPGWRKQYHYVMIDAQSAVKLAKPKNPGRWVEELQNALMLNNDMAHVWSTTPTPGKGALVTAWKTEEATHYLNLGNVIRAIEDRAPASHKPNAAILRDLEREVLKNF